MKTVIKNLNDRTENIRLLIRDLNMDCADLNGVAVTIPEDAPYPAVCFKGSKVILHNVSSDLDAGGVRATMAMPYNKDDKDDKARRFFGAQYRFSIDESWFE